MSLTRLRYLGFLLLVLVCACWIFLWNLGAHSISLRSDEVIYVRITQSILHKGAVFPLLHGDAPSFEKPPLKLWLAALPPLLFGESNLSFRVLDGLLGVLCVALTISIMRSISGSQWLALLSAAFLLAIPELVISHHGFRRAVLDGLLSVITLLILKQSWSLLETARATGFSGEALKSLRKRALFIGGLCALGVLTKSVAAFVPASCAIFSVVLAPLFEDNLGAKVERKALFLNRGFLSVLAFIVAPPVVFFIAYCGALWIVGGLKALRIFVGVEIFTRTLSGFEGHNTANRWFYLWSLFIRGAALPRYFLALGLVGAVVGARKERALSFLLVWGCLPVVLYSLAASRVPWYLNPFMPAMSMLAVAGNSFIFRSVSIRFNTRLACIGAILVVALSLPPFCRAIQRNVQVVLASTERIEADRFVDDLSSEFRRFVIVDGAISKRSKPRKGRFNVEGIYREFLSPNLIEIDSAKSYQPRTGEVVLVKESALGELALGWRKVKELGPFPGRSWRVVGVVY